MYFLSRYDLMYLFYPGMIQCTSTCFIQVRLNVWATSPSSRLLTWCWRSSEMSALVVRWRFCSASRSMLRNFRTISTLKETNDVDIKIQGFHQYLWALIFMNILKFIIQWSIKYVITYLTSNFNEHFEFMNGLNKINK